MSAPLGNKDSTLLVFPFVEYASTGDEKQAALRLVRRQQDSELIATALGLIEPTGEQVKIARAERVVKPMFCEVHNQDKIQIGRAHV